MARAAAHRLGHRASFTPMPEASGVGNGVHVHMSLQDASGAPMTYAPTGPMGLSMAAQHFCAGVLEHLPAICAITAPSPVSYLRLTPNRWAPTLIDIQQQDRGAALRICPVFAAADPAETARAVQSSNSASATAPPVRTWRWARSSSRAPMGCDASSDCLRRRTVPMRCLRHSARHWMAWRQARRSPAGSARSSWRRTCVTSARELHHVAEWAVNERCDRYFEIY